MQTSNTSLSLTPLEILGMRIQLEGSMIEGNVAEHVLGCVTVVIVVVKGVEIMSFGTHPC